MKIGFIGCGKIAQILIGYFVEGGIVEPGQIICSDTDQGALEKASKQFGIGTSTRNTDVFDQAEIVFLAIKPQSFREAVADCADKVTAKHILVSIMAGVTSDTIKSFLNAPVIRVMPNIPCQVGQMAAGYAVCDDVPGIYELFVKQLLNCAGLAIKVRESELDAVTGLSGSGPAFVAYLVKGFIDAGVSLGLDTENAKALALQTFIGTAKLLREKTITPEELITMVSSPNGTTVAGREVLESSDVIQILEKTIIRATERSKELSK